MTVTIVATKNKNRKPIPFVPGFRYGRWSTVSDKGYRISPSGHKDRIWECRCDCGTIRDVLVSCLRCKSSSKGSRSCGCLHHDVISKKAGAGAANSVFIHTKRGALRRGLDFAIDFDYFIMLSRFPCHYCGKPPSNKCDPQKNGKPKHNGAFIYSGLDRLDNLIGYTSDNCVPCCSSCNRAKSNRPLERFIRSIEYGKAPS